MTDSCTNFKPLFRAEKTGAEDVADKFEALGTFSFLAKTVADPFPIEESFMRTVVAP